MITRALGLNDIDRLREIHSQYFADEFPFPDFLNKFYCSLIVEDDKGIILAGGIRPICEVIAITNKERSSKNRYHAFAQLIQASMFICDSQGFNELTAFIQDKEWERNILKAGFVPTKGRSLVLGW